MRRSTMEDRKLRRKTEAQQQQQQSRTADRVRMRQKLKKAKILNRVAVFRGMNSASIGKIIEKMELETFDPRNGNAICEQGDSADRIYFIMEGTVRVVQDVVGGQKGLERVPVREMGELDFFGEACLTSGKNAVRGATVIPSGPKPVILLTLTRGNFINLQSNGIVPRTSLGAIEERQSQWEQEDTARRTSLERQDGGHIPSPPSQPPRPASDQDEEGIIVLGDNDNSTGDIV